MCKRIILSILILLFSSPGFAATYYISPSGDNGNAGDSCTAGHPWLTFAYAASQMSAGDTLYLCDGTYTTSDSGMLDDFVSGSDPNYTTYEAVNDGSAIIDGEYAAKPLVMSSKSWIKIKGIYFKDSGGSSPNVIRVVDSSNIYFQRVTGRNASDLSVATNTHVWSFENVDSSIVEDCAGWGNGRNTFLLFGGSDNNVIRRMWMKYHNKNATQGADCMQVYNSAGNIVENSICTKDSTWRNYFGGIAIWDNDANGYSDNNKFYGNVVYDVDVDTTTYAAFGVNSNASSGGQVTGTAMTDCVVINSDNNGLNWAGDQDLDVTRMTIINAHNAVNHRVDLEFTGESGIVLKDSILMNSNCGWEYSRGTPDTDSHSYNDFYGNSTDYCESSQGTGEFDTNPAFNTAKYGHGAYLIQPSALDGLGEGGGNVGAEVLYKYTDGVLGTDPLWPWPMEGRILAEAEVSVTYSVNQGNGEEGGLWKTLEDIYGPVRSAPYPTSQQACGSDPLSVEMGLTTAANATCKYDTSDVVYASMSGTFDGGGTTSHSKSVNQACGGSTVYYVRCTDGTYTNATSLEITVDVDSAPPPPSASKNIVTGGNITIQPGGTVSIQ